MKAAKAGNWTAGRGSRKITDQTAARASGIIADRAAGEMAGRIAERTAGRTAGRMGKLEWARKRASGKSRITAVLPYMLLCVLTVIGCWVFVGRQGVFGVKVDWLSQHSVLPDYFRRQFYETGKLFPEFAGNLGGGQNIFHFSYYGLYSPVFLISYILPFVKMGDYLMAVSIAGIFVSAGLLFYWLNRKGFSWEISLPVSALYIFAGPVIFQSCHQIMFINYMPFLITALLGVDRYFEKRRSGLYTLGVFLMIMTSFYFSIGGMLVLVLYGLVRYMEQNEEQAAGVGVYTGYKPGKCKKSRTAGFLKDGISFLLPMITAVLMSGFLLVPTAYAILGKREGGQAMSVSELLIPKPPLEGLVHGAYGIGLTTGIITVLITGLFYRKWRERLLHGGCLVIFIVPVFQWVLNGGLYVRGKVLIPFLPLCCYLTAVYLEKQKNREIPLKVNITAYALTIIWLLVSYFYAGEFSGEPLRWYLILAESILLFVCFGVYWRRGNLLLLTVPPVLCLILSGSFFYSGAGGTLDKKTYDHITDAGIGNLIDRTLAEKDGFWRLEQGGGDEEKSADLNRIWNTRQWISSLYSSAYNTDYQSFRKDVFRVEEPFRNDLMQTVSDNPLYQKLMGVKYVIGDADAEKVMKTAGYKPCLTEGKRIVYESENTAPIAYASNKVVGEQDYDSLEFPCNQTALMKYAVVTDSRSQGDLWKSRLEQKTVPVEIAVPETDREGLTIDRMPEDSYHIQAEKKAHVMCRIVASASSEEMIKKNTEKGMNTDSGEADEEENGKLLFLRFQIKNNCPNQDAAVWMNGIRNKLSAENHIYYNGNTTFTYATALEAGTSEVQLDFGQGDYEISDMECFLGDGSLLEDEKEPEEKLYQSPFEIDWEQTKGNRIQGKIQVQNTGYFITSIPYDDGFEIFIDGKRTALEKVNKAFLGCAVKKGKHQIEILYHAPGVQAGKYLACIGFLFFIIMHAVEKYQNNCTKKRRDLRMLL